jgi:hypothetical protein
MQHTQHQSIADLLQPHAGFRVTANGPVPVQPRTDGHKLTKNGLWVTGDFVLAEPQQNGRYTPGVCAFEGCKLDQMHGDGRIKVASPTVDKRSIDISWLPFCSEQYQVSADINDYVLVEVPIVVADIPNRNLDSFPYTELTAWRTANSLPAYATFRGKPVHQDHDNLDDSKAKGVIFDATFTPFRDKYHVKILKGFDRSKDQRLAKLVQERNRIGHSMGALVERTECSIPGCNYISDGTQTCKHINGGAGKGGIYKVNGKEHLAYESMLDFYYIESSSVEDPAYVVALSETVW